MTQETDSDRAQADHERANYDSTRAQVELGKSTGARVRLDRLKPNGQRGWRDLAILAGAIAAVLIVAVVADFVVGH